MYESAPHSRDDDITRTPSSRLGRWVRRLLVAFLGPLAILILAEGALRLVGFGNERTFFVPDSEPGYLRTNPHFTDLVFPGEFGITPIDFRIARQKAPNTVRVFVLGESAARGVPEPGFGLAPMLAAQLRPRFPTRKIEVYNLGITAINSHLMYLIAQELPSLQPDLIVVYAGNNEVIGPYGPGSAVLAKMLPLRLIRAGLWVGKFRVGQAVQRLVAVATHVDQHSLEWRGMQTFLGKTVRGDDPALTEVYQNFGDNLQRVVDSAAKSNCQVILCTVSANLQDSAPFASLHRADLDGPASEKFKSVFERGRLAFSLRDWPTAVAQLSQAVEIDPEYADAQYLLGRALEAQLQPEEARKHFLAALHWDALRFRPDAPINDTVRVVARRNQNRAILVDTAMELGFDPRSTQPVAGTELFWEHVHLRWSGNYRIALMIAEKASGVLRRGNPLIDTVVTESGCAEALGLTDYGRFQMVNTMAGLIAAPPFTNQLDYGKSSSVLRRELVSLREKGTSGAGLATAQDRVDKAWRNDPMNTFLPGHLAQIRADIGDLDGSLELIEQWKRQVPEVPEVDLQEAQVLVKMSRFTEAEQILDHALKLNPVFFPAYRALLDVWSSTDMLEKAEETFAKLVRRYPSSEFLRLQYADCLVRRGDEAGAKSQLRMVWGADPESQPAAEQLVRLLLQEGNSDEAVETMLQVEKFQPQNYQNHARLAEYYDRAHQSAKGADEMIAMTETGPVDAHFRGHLALRLKDLKRFDEMKVQLLEARDAAVEERDSNFVAEVDRVLAEQDSQANTE